MLIKYIYTIHKKLLDGLTDSTGAPRRVASATAKLAPRETLTFGTSAGGISIGIP